MLEYPDLNLLSIIIGFVISSVVGFLYYDQRTPTGALFMKELGLDPDNVDVNKLYFGIDFITRLFMTWGLAFVVAISGADDFIEGLLIGLFAWFAFIVTSEWSQVAFEKRNIKIYYLYLGYQLIVFVTLGPLFAMT